MTSQSSPALPIVSRVSPGQIFLAFVIAVATIALTWFLAHLPGPRGGTTNPAGPYFAMGCGFLLLLLSVGLTRVQVVANESELAWTGFLSSRRVRWAQVRAVERSEVMGKPVVRVVTEAGNFNLHHSLTNRDAMLALIESKLTHARTPVS